MSNKEIKTYLESKGRFPVTRDEIECFKLAIDFNKYPTDEQVNELAKQAMLTQYDSESHEEVDTAVNAYIIGFNDCKQFKP